MKYTLNTFSPLFPLARVFFLNFFMVGLIMSFKSELKCHIPIEILCDCKVPFPIISSTLYSIFNAIYIPISVSLPYENIRWKKEKA